MYLAAPVTLSIPSRRGTLRPTAVIGSHSVERSGLTAESSAFSANVRPLPAGRRHHQPAMDQCPHRSPGLKRSPGLNYMLPRRAVYFKPEGGGRANRWKDDGHRVPAQRQRGVRGAPGGRVAARNPSRALRHPFAQGRLRAAGPVRLLPRARRRPRQGDVRDARAVGGGPRDHHARRAVRGRPRPVRPRLRGGSRRAVRLLHPRHRAARQVPARSSPRANREPRSRGRSTSTSAAARAT